MLWTRIAERKELSHTITKAPTYTRTRIHTHMSISLNNRGIISQPLSCSGGTWIFSKRIFIDPGVRKKLNLVSQVSTVVSIYDFAQSGLLEEDLFSASQWQVCIFVWMFFGAYELHTNAYEFAHTHTLHASQGKDHSICGSFFRRKSMESKRCIYRCWNPPHATNAVRKLTTWW